MSKRNFAVFTALLAAVLYGISMPVSKLLLTEIPPTLMAALLYLGAGFGMLAVNLVKIAKNTEQLEAKVTKKELPYIAGTIALDVAAPILLMVGLKTTAAASASLLNNFEIVATSLIALLVFKEAVGHRMWLAITLISLSTIILSVQDFSNLNFSAGSIFIILAAICWGFENNFTRMLSIKDPLQIVIVKGFGSGIGALIIAIFLQEFSSSILYIGSALLLGFIAYGLSIYFYISAQRELGAARTCAYYAAAPFIGVILSWILLREPITGYFLVALVIMLLGTYYAITENHCHSHIHLEEAHNHRHNHSDGHHNRIHSNFTNDDSDHSHAHVHEKTEHDHEHLPDVHHKHIH
ncbi:MAG: EamA family transporter [Dethiobacteria bacterium]